MPCAAPAMNPIRNAPVHTVDASPRYAFCRVQKLESRAQEDSIPVLTLVPRTGPDYEARHQEGLLCVLLCLKNLRTRKNKQYCFQDQKRAERRVSLQVLPANQ